MRVYKNLQINETFKYDWIIEEEKIKEEYLKSLIKPKNTYDEGG